MSNFTPSPSGEANSAAKLIGVIIVIAVIAIGVYYWYALRPAAPSEETNVLTAADIPDLSATDVNISENVSPANTTESVPNLNPTDAANPFKDAYQNPFQ